MKKRIERGDEIDPKWRRTNVIRSVSCVFGTARLGSRRRGGLGSFWLITRKIFYWNYWGKCVLCRTLERVVSNK